MKFKLEKQDTRFIEKADAFNKSQQEINQQIRQELDQLLFGLENLQADINGGSEKLKEYFEFKGSTSDEVAKRLEEFNADIESTKISFYEVLLTTGWAAGVANTLSTASQEEWSGDLNKDSMKGVFLVLTMVFFTDKFINRFKTLVEKINKRNLLNSENQVLENE